MKYPELKRVFPVFYILTAVTVAVRFALCFTIIDPETGFYSYNAIGMACQWGFNLLLAAAALAFFWFGRVPLPADGLIIPKMNKAACVALIAAGLLCEMSALYTGVNEVMALLDGYELILRNALPALFNSIAGLLLIYTGILAFTGKQRRTGLIPAVVVIIWSAVLLVSTFLSYPISYHVSDNMLHILALCCAAFLMASFFKAILGVGPRPAVRKTIFFGLLTAYFGLTLALPRLVQLWINRINVLVPAAGQEDLYLLLALSAFGFFAARSMTGVEQAPPQQPFTALE